MPSFKYSWAFPCLLSRRLSSYLSNENPITRRVGLVKSVTYRIRSDSGSNDLPTLRLPGNACLVDLPGLDGTPLHDIIISEGIVDADAVVFIQRPPRILGRADDYLLSQVRRYISPEGSKQSGERIFLVLNARDENMTDNATLPDGLARAMEELMTSLVPDYPTHPATAKRGGGTPYFLTSAWLADAAQQRLKGQPVKDAQTYESTKQKLGIENRSDREVLETSQIPKLVEELTKFAKERRIEDKINDGENSLRDIAAALYRQYTSESRQQNSLGRSLVEKRNDELNARLRNAQKVIRRFRREQLQSFDDLRHQLMLEAKSICDYADVQVKQNMPEFWRTNYVERAIETTAGETSQLFYESILANAQVRLWGEINSELSKIANCLVTQCLHNLEVSQIAQKISRECYECLEPQKITTDLEQFISDHTEVSLTQMAHRLAMSQMTHPSYDFNVRTEGGKQASHSKLYEILLNVLSRYIPTNLDPIISEVVMQLTQQATIAYQQSTGSSTIASGFDEKPMYEMLYRHLADLAETKEMETEPSDFEHLVAEMRKIYEPFVASGCVDSFLNLYRYELLVIEKYLISQVVESTFDDLRSGKNPISEERIYQDLAKSNPDLKKQETLERKLAFIQRLKDG